MSYELGHALHVAGENHNRYCGPAAIAALARVSTAEAAATIRRVSQSISVRGVHSHYMRKALREFGLGTATYFVFTNTKAAPTLRNWLARHYGGDDPLLIGTTRHWLAVSGDRFVDSFSRRPTPLDEITAPTSKVREVYIVYPTATPAEIRAAMGPGVWNRETG